MMSLDRIDSDDLSACPQRWVDILAMLGKASEIVDLVRRKDRTDWGPGDLPRAAAELEAAAWGIDGYLIDLGFAPPWKDFPEHQHP